MSNKTIYKIPKVLDDELSCEKAIEFIDDMLSSKCYETWDDEDTKKRELALRKARYFLHHASMGSLWVNKEEGPSND